MVASPGAVASIDRAFDAVIRTIATRGLGIRETETLTVACIRMIAGGVGLIATRQPRGTIDPIAVAGGIVANLAVVYRIGIPVDITLTRNGAGTGVHGEDAKLRNRIASAAYAKQRTDTIIVRRTLTRIQDAVVVGIETRIVQNLAIIVHAVFVAVGLRANRKDVGRSGGRREAECRQLARRARQRS